jgi:hypothetical protein
MLNHDNKGKIGDRNAPTRFVRLSGLKIVLLFISTASWTVNSAAAQAAEASNNAIPLPLVYSVIVVVLVSTLLGIAAVRAALSDSAWSLSDALSEEVEVTLEQDVDGIKMPKFDDNLKPVMVTELRASSSRLIALLGLIAIMMMFIGFGVFILYWFALGYDVSNRLDGILKFLLAGMTMFAPYAVNKFSSLFDWMTPKKS